MTGCVGCDHGYSELKSYSCSLTQKQRKALGDASAVWASKDQVTRIRLDTVLYVRVKEGPGSDGLVCASSKQTRVTNQSALGRLQCPVD